MTPAKAATTFWTRCVASPPSEMTTVSCSCESSRKLSGIFPVCSELQIRPKLRAETQSSFLWSKAGESCPRADGQAPRACPAPPQ